MWYEKPMQVIHQAMLEHYQDYDWREHQESAQLHSCRPFHKHQLFGGTHPVSLGSGESGR